MRHNFEILELTVTATFEEVKKAYKAQAKKWHPDRFPDDARHLQKKAHDQFQKITDAFRELEGHFKSHDRGRYSADQPDSSFQRPNTNPGQADTDQNTPPSSTTEHENAPGFFIRDWPNGDRYEGQMRDEVMHGMGIYTSADGSVYTGQFRYGKPHGQGKLTFPNGDIYSGDFYEDKMSGKGTYNYANGDRFIGQFENDLPHGEGAHIHASGKVYAGQWEGGYLVDQR